MALSFYGTFSSISPSLAPRCLGRRPRPLNPFLAPLPGAKVKVGQPASWKTPQGYVCTLSNVALEVESNKTDGLDGIGVPHRVYLTTKDWEDKEMKCLIASLRARQTEQIHLEVVLGWDSPFELSVEGGKGVVHITGFVQPGPSFGGDEDEDDDDEDLGALLGEEDEEEDEEEEVKYLIVAVLFLA